ncbi:hypothetical protein [Streptomyces sp. NPDC090445]|uniref:hypothetical protein n=1 Tax=Streptomyces sp. NPDC090445 TaxID=3365963 RepID=UPI00380585E8
MSAGQPGSAAGPELVVGRLSATLRYDPAAAPPGPDRLRGPLRHAVDGHLEAALRALALPPGRWCLARLDLTVSLDLDRPDPALARDWSRAVAAAIARTVREDRGAAVHYRNDADLLADAVTGLAAGRLERLWAWRQTGLVRPEDPAPAAAPGEAVLAVLERHPRQAAATVLRAAERCGAAALDRALGRRGWQRLAALATANAPYPPGGTDPDPATRALARTLLAGSRFAALVRAARLRPAEPTAAAWAVLVLAETDPAALHRPGTRPGLHRLLAEALGAPDGMPTRLPAGPRPSTAEPGREASARPASAAPAEREAPPRGRRVEEAGEDPPGASDALVPGCRTPAPDAPGERAPVRTPGLPDRLPAAEANRQPGPEPAAEPAAEGGLPTDWAGLPFLLATAAEAGLPDRVLDDPALAARPLPWVLHAAVRALVPAVPAGDPAALALAGLDRTRAARVLGADPPTPDEQARIDALATAWALATATRLATTVAPAPSVAAVTPTTPVAASALATPVAASMPAVPAPPVPPVAGVPAPRLAAAAIPVAASVPAVSTPPVPPVAGVPAARVAAAAASAAPVAASVPAAPAPPESGVPVGAVRSVPPGAGVPAVLAPPVPPGSGVLPAPLSAGPVAPQSVCTPPTSAAATPAPPLGSGAPSGVPARPPALDERCGSVDPASGSESGLTDAAPPTTAPAAAAPPSDVPAPADADARRAVAALARRRGRVAAEAGWIEVVLAAGDADPQVRRAGLDLDPGWIGWLGAVVRYRYV